jgi:hypothetical protein
MFCGEIDLGRNHIKEADFAGRMKTYKHLTNGEVKREQIIPRIVKKSIYICIYNFVTLIYFHVLFKV